MALWFILSLTLFLAHSPSQAGALPECTDVSISSGLVTVCKGKTIHQKQSGVDMFLRKLTPQIAYLDLTNASIETAKLRLNKTKAFDSKDGMHTLTITYIGYQPTNVAQFNVEYQTKNPGVSLDVYEKGTPTEHVYPGEVNAVLGRFVVKPTGDKVELRKLRVGIVQMGSTELVGSVHVLVNGNSVYSAIPSTFTTATMFMNDVSLGSPKTMFVFPLLQDQQESVVEVWGTISPDATLGDGYGAAIDVTEIKTFIEPKIIDPGTTFVVSKPRPVVIGVAKLTNQVFNGSPYGVVQGANDVNLAKFTIDASGSSEDIIVHSWVFTDEMGGLTPAVTDITNLKIFEGGSNTTYETLNSTASIISPSSIAFNFKTPIVIKKTDGIRTFWLKGDISSGAAAGATHKFTVLTASNVVGAQSSQPADAVFGTAQTVVILNSGALNVSVSYASGHTLSKPEIIQVGQKQKQLTVFKFKSFDENIKITKLTFTATGTAAYTDFGNVTLYLNDKTAPFATLGQCSTIDALTCNFESTDKLFEVPAGQDVYVRVKADISDGGAAQLGHTVGLEIVNPATDIIAKGKNTLAADKKTGSSTIVALKQIVPFSVVITGFNPLAGSSQIKTILKGSEIGSFQIKNNGPAAITLEEMTVYDAGTNSVPGLVYELYKSNANSLPPVGAPISTSAKDNLLIFDVSAVTLQAGQYVTLFIKIGTGGENLQSGDNFQLYVPGLGAVTYNISEVDLGYDGTADGDTIDTIEKLFVSGEPILGSLTKQ